MRLGQRGYLDTIEKAVSAGDTVLIEDIGTSIDPVLDPLIGRNTIKKGKEGLERWLQRDNYTHHMPLQVATSRLEIRKSSMIPSSA